MSGDDGWRLVGIALWAAMSLGCGDEVDGGGGNGAAGGGGAASSSTSGTGGGGGAQDAIELAGTWHYTGNLEDYAETLVITETTVEDAVTSGPPGSSSEEHGTYAVLAYDNDLDRLQIELTSASAGYGVPMGTVFFNTYVLQANTVDIYSATDAYPTATGGVEGQDFYTFAKE